MGSLYDKIKQRGQPSSDFRSRVQTATSTPTLGQRTSFRESIAPTPAGEVDASLKKQLTDRGMTDRLQELETLAQKKGSFVRELPGATKQVASGFAKTFIPALTNFFQRSGSIFGEAIAYAVDPIVRQEYTGDPNRIDPALRQQLQQRGMTQKLIELEGVTRTDILPTITDATPADIVKDAVAAGIEAAVYRSFPNLMQKKLLARGGVGALEGLGFAISEGLAEDKSAEEIIKALPAYGVTGSVATMIAPYLLPLLKAEIKQAPKQVKRIFQGIQREVLEGLPPNARNIPVKGGEQGARKIPVNIQRDLLTTPKQPLALPSPSGKVVGEGFTMSTAVDKSKIAQQKAIDKAKKAFQKNPNRETLRQLKEARSVFRQVDDAIAIKLEQETLSTPPVQNNVEKVASVSDDIVARETTVSQEQLPVGEGKAKVSRLEARVKSTLNDVPLEKAEQAGISTFRQMNKTDQIQRAVKYVEANPDEALAVLKGDKPAPSGLLHNSIALALEQKATTQADKNLAIKLASLRSTRAGQEISILTEADPTNPVTAINEIIKARAARVLKRQKVTPEKAVSKEVSSVLSKVNKQKLKIAEAEKLLAEIAC